MAKRDISSLHDASTQADYALEAAVIDIWIASLHATATGVVQAIALLDDVERARAARFVKPEHQRRFVISHSVLRQLLAAYLDMSPHAIVYAHHPHGKPYVSDRDDVQFNMAHTQDMAIYAFATRPVGVDIESSVAQLDEQGIAERFFAAEEIAYLNKRVGHARHLAFLRAWTRKEAYLKAEGSGLSYPLRHCVVSSDSDSYAQLLHLNGDVSAAQAWELYPVPVPQDYLAAVAIASCATASATQQATRLRVRYV